MIQAYEADGLNVAITINSTGFERLQVTDPTAATAAKVELGIDWRSHPPTTLEIGPVLHPDDAVANKICILYSRAQARDYIDADAILHSGRYSSAQLITLATDHDPGFDVCDVRQRATCHPPASTS